MTFIFVYPDRLFDCTSHTIHHDFSTIIYPKIKNYFKKILNLCVSSPVSSLFSEMPLDSLESGCGASPLQSHHSKGSKRPISLDEPS